MLRDIPKIYLIFFVAGFILLSGVLAYSKSFIRGTDTLSLNDIALASTVAEIDQMSRLEKSTLVLEDTFEVRVWEEMVKWYPKGSEVKIDYLFDTDINSYYSKYGKSAIKKASSEIYVVGGSNEPQKGAGVYNDRPVKAVRIKVRKTGDTATAGSDGWTYVSTIKLDAADK